MNNKGITAEKLAQVAALVAAQKAKLSNSRPEVTKKSGNIVPRGVAPTAAAKHEKQAAKTAEREAKRAARGENTSDGTPSWLRKIGKLRQGLPAETENLRSLSQALTGFSDVELTNALQYVEFERRVRGLRATGEARAKKAIVLKPGDKVLIKNCNARKFIGQVGVVTLVRRIRAFVEVPGYDTKAYVFSTDVEVLEASGRETVGQNILDVGEDLKNTGT